MQIFSFLPIANADSKILILGTMPSIESLNQNEYYGHSRNTFWKILFALFDEPFSNVYDVKRSLLLKKRIALWDVLQTCKREDSLDVNITEEIPYELLLFFKVYPKINPFFLMKKRLMTIF